MDEVGFEPTTSCNGTHDMVKSLRSKRATTVPSALQDVASLQEIRKGRPVSSVLYHNTQAGIGSTPCEEASYV